MKLLLATNNKDKISEIAHKLKEFDLQLLTLNDLEKEIDVIEDSDTLEGNAFKKAKEIFNATGIPTIADDTGLFVDALNGEPGVYSSRYAGDEATYDDNCRKLIKNMEGIPGEKRNAHFKTVICFYVNFSEQYFFEGIVKGKIINDKRGTGGFGYDPLFIPDGFDKTYAEMTLEEKNILSHRAKALEQFRILLDKKYSELNI
ncbi:MAG: RdgB/HAM1 family non-canonical purine NTP pyrophosphatase [Ignavibacteria bacterium]|nr:RdgB/HAM1 family non-canonical purine NTP pyrophosphatase [Ignavibacteria bacterium]